MFEFNCAAHIQNFINTISMNFFIFVEFRSSILHIYAERKDTRIKWAKYYD